MSNECKECLKNILCGKGNCFLKGCPLCIVQHYIKCCGDEAKWNSDNLEDTDDEDMLLNINDKE